MVDPLTFSHGSRRRIQILSAASIFIAAHLLTSCTTSPKIFGSRPAWNDIDVVRENVELPRANFVGYANRKGALSAESDSNFQSLNGGWKFHSPGAAPVGLESTGNAIFTVPTSLLGVPTLALPVLEADGLPLGLQVIGFRDEDGKLFAGAGAVLVLFE